MSTCFYRFVAHHKLFRRRPHIYNKNQGVRRGCGERGGIFLTRATFAFSYFSCLEAIYGAVGHFDPPPGLGRVKSYILVN